MRGLGCIYEYLGLEINNAKSFVIFSKCVRDSQELNSILGFQIASLPINHLGPPVTGRSIHHKDHESLLVSLENMRIRWKDQRLSYSEHIQLRQWVFHGWFNYIMQSSAVSSHTVDKLCSITHWFVWNDQWEVTWSRMIIPRSECGLGIKDFSNQQATTII